MNFWAMCFAVRLAHKARIFERLRHLLRALSLQPCLLPSACCPAAGYLLRPEGPNNLGHRREPWGSKPSQINRCPLPSAREGAGGTMAGERDAYRGIERFASE